ncbi:hypothetical protein [uncultured Cyclobacterium sp.]|uniref:hypothetical protein n=1 Tax=uncultured Cyclobacterium sp. TaxID=453820 RepID=UPI0030EB7EB1
MKVSLIIIILGLLTSCNSNTTEMDNEELNILNQKFIELIGIEGSYEPLPVPPMPLWEESTREDSLRYEKESAEFENLLNNRKLGTSVLKIYLYDSLTTYKSNDFLDGILSPNNFEANFPVDTTWIKLIRKLNGIEDPKGFDINQITETGNYTIVTKAEFNDTTDNKRRIGMMTMSRVAFSPAKQRGVFYYTFTCGSLCGWGSLVFIERKGAEWKIVGQRNMWVS